MVICSDGHDEVCYSGLKCPVCEMKEDMDVEIEDLEDEIKDLETQLNNKE